MGGRCNVRDGHARGVLGCAMVFILDLAFDDKNAVVGCKATRSRCRAEGAVTASIAAVECVGEAYRLVVRRAVGSIGERQRETTALGDCSRGDKGSGRREVCDGDIEGGSPGRTAAVGNCYSHQKRAAVGIRVRL